MARCEDFPCCGHELGCCPDFDAETGAQLNMVCVCGAKLPVNSSSSICAFCMKHDYDEDGRPVLRDEYQDDYDDSDETEDDDYGDKDVSEDEEADDVSEDEEADDE